MTAAGRISAPRTDAAPRSPDFALFWAAATASQVGTRVGNIALTLLAVSALAATPLQTGLLTAAQTLGALLVGLPAGLVVDRVRRHRLMLGMDLLRGGALLTVAVAAAAGWLGLPLLFVVALTGGIATIFFDLAQMAHVPALVDRDGLVRANARLQASQSVALVSGPGMGGALVSLVGGAGTVLTGSLSFLVSATLLGRMRSRAPAAGTNALRGRLRAELGEGLRFVFRDAALRAIALCTSTCNLFMSIVTGLLVLFLVRVVDLSAGQVGVVLAASGAGGVAAAFTAARWARRFGKPRAICLALLVAQPFALLLPSAAPGYRALPVVLGMFVLGWGNTVYNILQVSLRQASCPDHLLGRINAAGRVLAWGTMPIGGLVGGVLGTVLGVRGALWLAAAGLIAAVGWLIRSPLWRGEGVAADPDDAAVTRPDR